VRDDTADRQTIALLVVGHHGRLGEDVVARLDLLEGAPDTGMLSMISIAPSLVEPVGIEPTWS
jgi:hypothetical protein